MAIFVRSHLNFNQSEAINLDYVKTITNGMLVDNFFIRFGFADGSEKYWTYPNTNQGGNQYTFDLKIVNERIGLE